MSCSPRRARAVIAGLAAAVALPATAQAAPVSFTLRVEGAATTLFEGPVTTDARPVDGGDGTGPHRCDGTNNATYPTPGPTVGTAMADETDRRALSWEASWSPTYNEFLLNTIDGETPNYSATSTFWSLYQNGTATSTGMCEVRPAPGDEILWAVTTGSEPILRLSGPTVLNAGQAASYAVVDASSSPPGAVAGAAVAGAVTDSSGHAAVRFPAAGSFTVKAAKSGAVRSNALVVCVHNNNDGRCGTIPPNGASTPVRRRPPVAGAVNFRNGARFSAGRAPRLLVGDIGVDRGNLKTVELRLSRRAHGHCEYFSATLGRLRRGSCGRGWLFRVGSAPHWSYLLPDRLPEGSYQLDVVPFDTAGARGKTRSVFFSVATARRVRHRHR